MDSANPSPPEPPQEPRPPAAQPPESSTPPPPQKPAESPYGAPVLAELPKVPGGPPRPGLAPRRPVQRVERRRVGLPLFLFAATCLSTFWAGSWAGIIEMHAVGAKQVGEDRLFVLKEGWVEEPAVGQGRPGPGEAATPLNGFAILGRWWDGVVYMLAVMAIILSHEMGHFIQAVRYKVPASFPFFIPMPFTPLGTMGAVIGMQGSKADRKELFDIGLTGPLAGLVVAIPIAWYGIMIAEPAPVSPHGAFTYIFGDPLLFKLIIKYLHPELKPGMELAANPIYLAGWVGMLITGLNMLPVSQLDGGHVSYALFGRYGHWVARAFMVVAILYVAFARVYGWAIMLLLVMFIGVDHPPTSNDQAELGWPRRIVGALSLAIPIFCLSPNPLQIVQF